MLGCVIAIAETTFQADIRKGVFAFDR